MESSGSRLKSGTCADPDEDRILHYFLGDINDQIVNNDVTNGEIANIQNGNFFQNGPNPSNDIVIHHPYEMVIRQERTSNSDIDTAHIASATPLVQYYGRNVVPPEDQGVSSKQQAPNAMNLGRTHSSCSSSSLQSLLPGYYTSSSSLSSANGNLAASSNVPVSAGAHIPAELKQAYSQNPVTKSIITDPLLMMSHQAQVSNTTDGSKPSSQESNQSISPSHLEWLNNVNVLARQQAHVTNAPASTYAKNNIKTGNPPMGENPKSDGTQQIPQYFFSPSLGSTSNPINTYGNSFSTLAATIAQQQEDQNKLEQKFMMLQKPSNLALPPPMTSFAQQQSQLSVNFSEALSMAGVIPSNNTVSNIATDQNTEKPESVVSNMGIPPTQQIPNMSFKETTMKTPKENVNQESEEKRARRLARNRVSARLSRRKKKERLESLGDKVNKLHNNIEDKRREIINEMENNLSKLREHEFIALASVLHSQMDMLGEGKEDHNISPKSREQNVITSDIDEINEKVSDIMHTLGPSCDIRQAVISFQYTLLRQLILPYHHQFMLWLTLQPQRFFTTAKEQHAKTTGRISSKQIGEELTSSTQNSKANSKKASLSCDAFDPSRSWPLFAYEHMFSAEQEEKIMQAYLRVMEANSKSSKSDNMKQRSHIWSALAIVANLKKNMQIRSHLASHRSEDVFSRILKPDQTLLLLSWLRDEKNRSNFSLVKRVLERNRSSRKLGKVNTINIDLKGRRTNTSNNTIGRKSESNIEPLMPQSKDFDDGDDLLKLCRTLNDTLKVNL